MKMKEEEFITIVQTMFYNKDNKLISIIYKNRKV